MTAADPRSWMWAEACAMIERAEQLHRQFFRRAIASEPTGYRYTRDVGRHHSRPPTG